MNTKPNLFTLLVLLPLACGDESSDTFTGSETADSACGIDANDPFADCVIELEAPADTNFNHEATELVLGEPQGSLDTVSLGCGGVIVVGFDEPIIRDIDGPDFIIFENPFPGFPEIGEVSVSNDGENWDTFPCDPVSLEGCAGVSETLAFPGTGIDPTDPAVAGGDSFDLEELGPAEARFVRIRDVSADYWEPIDMDYCDPGQAGKGGFDLDAVAVAAAET